jgi:hypothetical protein
MRVTGQSSKTHRTQLFVEQLESRTVPSALIHWVNEGNAISDTDGFNAVFGSNAAIARSDVETAINQWVGSLQAFNYSDGSQFFFVTIKMGGSGNGASAGSPSRFDPNGRPEADTITIGSGADGHGSGWYLDPTPTSSEEFQGTIVNPYVMDATPGGPAAGLYDLESAALGGMTQALGMKPASGSAFNSSPFFHNVGQADAATVGNLWVFDGPDVQALFTSDNNGNASTGGPLHTAEPSAANVVSYAGTTYYGFADAANPLQQTGRRYLLSYADLLVLHDIYGYLVTSGTPFNAYVNFDPVSGNILVRGGSHGDDIYPSQANPSNDTIILDTEAGAAIGAPFDSITVSVSIDNPTPGTGPNIPFLGGFLDDPSVVKSISVDSGDGSDTIDVNSTEALPLTITNGGTANIVLGTGNLGALAGRVAVNGSGSDSLTLDDHAAPAAEAYTIGNSIVGRTGFAGLTYAGVTSLTLNAGNFDSAVNVNGTAAGTQWTINAGNGLNTLTFGGLLPPLTGKLYGAIQGNVSVNGQAGFNILTVDDRAANLPSTFTLGNGAINRANAATVSYANVQSLILDGGSGGNTINVLSTTAGTHLAINAGGGTNTVTFGGLLPPLTGKLFGTIQGNVSVNGQGGSTTVVVDDSAANAPATFTLSNGGVSRSNTATVSYANVQSLVVDGGSGGNTFLLSPSVHNLDELPATVTINGGGSSTAVLNDQSTTSTFGPSWTVSGSSVARSYTTVSLVNGRLVFITTTRTINYSGLSALTLNSSPSSGFTLSPSVQTLNELPATVTINGGGSSSAVLNDQSTTSTFGSSWTVSGSSVVRSATNFFVFNGRPVFITTTRTINYSGLGALTLNSSPSSGFTLSPSVHNLDELPATVTINGGASSTAVLNDQNNKPEFASDWTVNSTNVARSYSTLLLTGSGPIVITTTRTINYSGIGDLTLNGGASSAFTLSPGLHNLDELPATVTITGGASSTATFNDQSNTPRSSSTWTVSGSNITRSYTTNTKPVITTTRTINYSGIGDLTLNTDNSGDTVTVNITHTSGYNLTLHGGSGSNTLHLFEVLGDRNGPFNPNPVPQGSGTVTAAYPAPGLVSTFTYTNMQTVDQLPNPDKSFVQALYHTALRRDASQAELDQWAAQIPTLGREGVARAINHLPEAFDHVIVGYFQSYLHEQPSATEEARLEKLFEHGATQEQVLADVLGSGEFFQQAIKSQEDEHESADVRYVEALFQDLLGYKEDQLSNKELHFWLGELDELGRRGVALELLRSEPYRTRTVTEYFSTILQRTQPPSAAEVDKLADSGEDLLQIQIELEASPEFYRNGR